MTIIALGAICLLACVFFLFVLFQWTRDPKRKTATPTAVDGGARNSADKQNLQIVRPERNIEEPDSVSGSFRRVQGKRGRSHDCGPGCNQCERTAYEKVARSFRASKKT